MRSPETIKVKEEKFSFSSIKRFSFLSRLPLCRRRRYDIAFAFCTCEISFSITFAIRYSKRLQEKSGSRWPSTLRLTTGLNYNVITRSHEHMFLI